MVSRFRFNVVTLPLGLLTAIAAALLARAIVYDFIDAEQRSLEAATLVADRCQATLADAIIAEDANAFDAWLANGPLPYGVERIRAFDATGKRIAEVNDRHIDHTSLTPMVRWLAENGIFPEPRSSIMRPVFDNQQRQVGSAIVDLDLYGEFAHALEGWVVVGLVTCIVISLFSLWSSSFAKRRSQFLSLMSHFAAHMQQGHGMSRLECRIPSEFSSLTDALNDLAGTQETQEAARRFISNVLESMPDSLIVVNPDSSIRSVNKATLKLLGYSEEELGDRQFSIICSADGQHLTPERLDDFLGSGSRRDTEVIYTSKFGERIPVALSGSAITDSSNRRTGYVCIATDIRPRKRAEAEQQALHNKFIQTSRQAGMAEVATGVLHNVGNVLNSVNVSATLIADRVRDCEVKRLLQATALMEEHMDDLPQFLTQDAKGSALPNYLIAISRQIAADQGQLFDEIDSLTRNVGHIKTIVSTQQQLSKSSSLIEMIAPDRLVEEALEMSGKIADRSHIRVIRKFEHIPDVETDRHRVLQVLVNLINNAVDAMAESDSARSNLTIGITLSPDNDESVRITVSDTGVGIEEDVLTKIFTLGFTTKEDGHGFGLHSSSLTMTELGGTLNVSSDGPGTGASFTLELPVRQSIRSSVA
jgi:PAS domain S-box-containing protein